MTILGMAFGIGFTTSKTTVGFNQDEIMKSVRVGLLHFGRIPAPQPKTSPQSQVLSAPRFFVKGYRLGVLDEN
jgi:hypothetical protein